MEGFSTAPQLSSAPVVTGIVAGTNITIDPVEGINVVTINAPGAGPGGGVLTIAGVEGVVTLSSPDDTININVDGQDIGLTAAGIITASAGTGISITGTQDITINNQGVLSVTDGDASSTGIITLTGGTGVEVVNGPTRGTFVFTNAGVTQLTGGDGISLSGQTGSVTIGNLGVLSASAGAGIGVSTTSGVATISNKGVRTLADLSGAVLLSGGTGIGIATSPDTNTITLSNTGITSLTPGTGIGVSGSTINNKGVLTIADLSGAITLSATGMTITPSGQNLAFDVTAAAVSSVNAQTGAVLIEAVGAGISVTNTETPSIGIANTLPGFVESGTIDQTGFSAVTTGPYAGYGFFLKSVTNASMNANGLIIATTGGTALVSYQAWLITVEPTAGGFDIYVADDPVVVGETWQLHYGIISYGTAP